MEVCKQCGSHDLEISAWVKLNSGEVVGSGNDGPTGQIWCPVCETHDTETVELPNESEGASV